MEFDVKALTATCLDYVNEETVLDFDTIDEAYIQAEVFTTLGFEVSEPISYDGQSYSITITR